jgi:hypothetical protein
MTMAATRAQQIKLVGSINGRKKEISGALGRESYSLFKFPSDYKGFSYKQLKDLDNYVTKVRDLSLLLHKKEKDEGEIPKSAQEKFNEAEAIAMGERECLKAYLATGDMGLKIPGLILREPPFGFPIRTLFEKRIKLEGQSQDNDLFSLCLALQEELSSSKGDEKIIEQVHSCVKETCSIIDRYRKTKDDILSITITSNELSSAANKELEQKQKVALLNDYQVAFVKDVKAYEAIVAKYSLGQRVFMALSVFVGGLLGLTVGLTAVVGGVLVGGMVGGVTGGVVGAIVGMAAGGIAGLISFFTALKISVVVADSAAAAFMASYKTSKAVTNPFFLTPEQRATISLKDKMLKDVKKDFKEKDKMLKDVKKDFKETGKHYKGLYQQKASDLAKVAEKNIKGKDSSNNSSNKK